MIKSDNFVSEYNVCTQALNESRHTFIQGMDRTHIGEYYEISIFLMLVVWKSRPVIQSSFYLVIHHNCQHYNVISILHIYL